MRVLPKGFDSFRSRDPLPIATRTRQYLNSAGLHSTAARSR